MPKPHKDSTKEDIYRSISLMNIEAKITQQNTCKPNQHQKVGFVPEMQGWMGQCMKSKTQSM